jgi:hypothetical protein
MPAMPSDPLWPLAPGVYGAAVDADLVFLDVQADAYLCLPADPQAVRLDRELAALIVRDPDLAASLLAKGLVAAPCGAGEIASRRQTPPPGSSALSPTTAGLRCRDTWPMARGMIDLFLTYRGRRFADLLRLAEGRVAGPGRRGPSPELLDLVAAFHRWLPYAPAPGKCLLRSFMLLRLLQRRGLDANWVFGVATWPFRAHCWLQSGEMALDDTVDRLSAFTPILVI